MAVATITSKGQITIPREVRILLGLESGDKVDFSFDSKGKVTFIPITKKLSSLKGLVPKPKEPVSLESMKATVKARGARD